MTKGARSERRRGIGESRHNALLFGRVAWVAVALVALVIFVVSIFGYWTEIQRVCLEGARACSDKGLLTQENMRQLERLGLSVRLYSAYVISLRVVSLTVWVVVGAVIFWRKPEDRMALLVASMLVTFGSSFQSFSYGTSFGFSLESFLEGYSGAYSPVLSPLIQLLAALGFTTLILFLYLFPDGSFVPRWALFPALAWIANDCEGLVFPELFAAYRWDDVVGFVLFFVPALCAVGSQIYRYRRISGPAQRQQTKWVIFGISIVFGGFLVLVALQGVFAGFDPTGVLGGLFTQTMITVLFLMIPLSIGVAILRSRLFDIDVLINRTLVYGTLTAILIFTYLVIVVSVQYVIRTLTGQESQLAIVASTLVIAALFNPLRRRVQAFVDRRFYRRKYDAKKTLEAFSAKLREETDLGTLSDHLVGVVGETMRPAHVSLWLRPDAAPKEGEQAH